MPRSARCACLADACVSLRMLFCAQEVAEHPTFHYITLGACQFMYILVSQRPVHSQVIFCCRPPVLVPRSPAAETSELLQL